MPFYLDDVIKDSNLLEKIQKHNSNRPETYQEILRRFAKLRFARSHEWYGPNWSPLGNDRTMEDADDQITDEEICFKVFKTIDPKRIAVIMADTTTPEIQKQKEWYVYFKHKRDSTTPQQKREAREKVHNYTLLYDDDTPEQAEARYQRYLEHKKKLEEQGL